MGKGSGLTFLPIPDSYFQLKTRVHNIIANLISPYDPGEVELSATHPSSSSEAIVRIKIARLPDETFETHIAKDKPVREEILKAGQRAGEYFKEKMDDDW